MNIFFANSLSRRTLSNDNQTRVENARRLILRREFLLESLSGIVCCYRNVIRRTVDLSIFVINVRLRPASR